jgi:hypothetical protein
MLGLFEFSLFLFALPIAISTLVVLWLPLGTRWSNRTNASILALSGPLLEVLFGVFLWVCDHKSPHPEIA